jgi:hypothetical protein
MTSPGNTRSTLAIDVGDTIIGIYCLEAGAYTAYRPPPFAQDDSEILRAIARIQAADEAVFFLGTNFNDLRELGRFARLKDRQELPLKADAVVDMARICSPRLWQTLFACYEYHFGPWIRPVLVPPIEDDYVYRNYRDCSMTAQLWRKWKAGKLRPQYP